MLLIEAVWRKTVPDHIIWVHKHVFPSSQLMCHLNCSLMEEFRFYLKSILFLFSWKPWKVAPRETFSFKLACVFEFLFSWCNSMQVLGCLFPGCQRHKFQHNAITSSRASLICTRYPCCVFAPCLLHRQWRFYKDRQTHFKVRKMLMCLGAASADTKMEASDATLAVYIHTSTKKELILIAHHWSWMWHPFL